MAVISLALWTAFALVALGLRPLLHRRRHGTSGRVHPAGGRPPAAHAAETVHTLAMLAGIAAPVLDLAGVLEVVEVLDSAAVHAAGIAATVTAIAVVAAAQAHMAASWRIGTDPDERTALVTSGPFSVVRHPVLAGTVLAVAGLALVVPNAAALAAVPLIALAAELGARGVEEPNLRGAHGTEYAAYAARVGRFVPGLGRDRAGLRPLRR